MMCSRMGHPTSFRSVRGYRPVLHSYSRPIITVFRGKSYGSFDDDRVINLGTTALIAFTGRHRVYGPITKPIDNWNSVDLRRNVTAGDAVTLIRSPISNFRAEGT